MQRSKKIFLFFAFLFLGIIGFIVYDFSRRTTFPGKKASEKKIEKDTLKVPLDTVRGDSIPSVRR
jgi:hypothetical protein